MAYLTTKFLQNKLPDIFYVRLFYYISTVMGNKEKRNDDKLDFNGGWSFGEAAHHISKKMTQKTIKSKKSYTRKKKHKNKDDE